jgi:acyl carrier protein
MSTLTSQSPSLSNSPSLEQLLAVWQETLGIPDAGVDENFFDAGGTSLLAARLAGRIKAQFACTVSAADILSHPSVRQLAKKLSGSEPGLDRTASDKRAAMQRRIFKRPER